MDPNLSTCHSKLGNCNHFFTLEHQSSLNLSQCKQMVYREVEMRHDTQHNDTQLNDTQQNDSKNNDSEQNATIIKKSAW
jgi:hypothetical protein